MWLDCGQEDFSFSPSSSSPTTENGDVVRTTPAVVAESLQQPQQGDEEIFGEVTYDKVAESDEMELPDCSMEVASLQRSGATEEINNRQGSSSETTHSEPVVRERMPSPHLRNAVVISNVEEYHTLTEELRNLAK